MLVLHVESCLLAGEVSKEEKISSGALSEQERMGYVFFLYHLRPLQG